LSDDAGNSKGRPGLAPGALDLIDAAQLLELAGATTPSGAQAFFQVIAGYLDGGRLIEAERILGELKAAHGFSSDPELRADLAYWQGEIDQRANRRDSAAKSFSEAAESTQDPLKKSQALVNAGLARLIEGKLGFAEESFEQARAIARASGNTQGILHALLGLAKLELGRRDLERALQLLEEARKLSADRLSGVEQAQVLMEIGIVLAVANLPDAAEKSYSAAREAVRTGPADLREPDLVPRLLEALASNERALEGRRGKFSEASQKAASSSTVMALEGVPRVNPNRFEIADDLIIEAVRELGQGHVERGLSRALDAIDEGRAANFREGVFRGQCLVSQALAALGYYEPALRFALAAVADLEALRGEETSEATKIGFVAARTEIYGFAVDLGRIVADLQCDNSFLQQSLELVERAKSRTLIELLARTDLKPPESLPAELVARESYLLGKQRDLARPVTDASVKILGAPTTLSACMSELDEIWLTMEQYAPEYVALRRGTPLVYADCRDLLHELSDTRQHLN